MSCLLRNIHVDTPYKISRMPNQLHYTYLDTFGRPVLVATKNNLVEQHIQDFVVRCTVEEAKWCLRFEVIQIRSGFLFVTKEAVRTCHSLSIWSIIRVRV